MPSDLSTVALDFATGRTSVPSKKNFAYASLRGNVENVTLCFMFKFFYIDCSSIFDGYSSLNNESS